jgi:hypothetical protein
MDFKQGHFFRVGFLSAIILMQCAVNAQGINRKALVQRHAVHVDAMDSLASLTVGNGSFAFTVDATGMQTFPDHYANGVPLGTQSDWGWHSFPNVDNNLLSSSQKQYALDGRQVSYTVQTKGDQRSEKASEYFRVNPHRLQLGNIGLELLKQDGSIAGLKDIVDIQQVLDPYTGIITSKFKLEGFAVEVETSCHQQKDLLGFRIHSDLIRKKRLNVFVRLPYPNGEFKDAGNHYLHDANHQSKLLGSGKQYVITHVLDTTQYHLQLVSSTIAKAENFAPHQFRIVPESKTDSLNLVIGFSAKKDSKLLSENANTVRSNSIKGWHQFWQSGGAIDLAGSKDPRARELERRIVLSQYLTKLQCTSSNPPQETGLTYNSWFGKPHIEMHWWHAVHFAQWGRHDLMEKSLDWYFRSAEKARAIANRQGYKGIRWQKMTDNNGDETPSSVGAFLIWQQPHLIYMVEMLYRKNPTSKVLDKYKELVFATADFMADFPERDEKTGNYNLGKGLIPAQECFDPLTTFNPTYELAYWTWALQTAQQWRSRAGLKPNPQWQEVVQHLAPLPESTGVYLASESTPDCYTNPRYLADHPAVLGAYGMLPAVQAMDTAIMKNTLKLVQKSWFWNKTWGWDYPMMAMTASRLHLPEDAIDALMMPVQKNTYLKNGHNYQDGRLTIYLPGNGGLLSAVALMCTGGDNDTTKQPGFPKNGNWKVRWEGLYRSF